MTTSSRRPSLLADVLGAGSSVILLGLISALAWGAGDFGGGTLARRAPLLGVVLGTQVVGLVLALAIGLARGETFPQGADLGWAVAAMYLPLYLYRTRVEDKKYAAPPAEPIVAPTGVAPSNQ